jgi:hypothetical protein
MLYQWQDKSNQPSNFYTELPEYSFLESGWIEFFASLATLFLGNFEKYSTY